MRTLNSIILEGTICTNPEKIITDYGDEKLCLNLCFMNHTAQDCGNYIEFPIMVSGSSYNGMLGRLKKDREIRIVGNLSKYSWTNLKGEKVSGAVVNAEHLEVKTQL